MGSYVLIDEQRINNCINEIKNSLGKTVTISPKARTSAQNRYYFNIVGIIADYVGKTPARMHEDMKWTVLGPEFRDYQGKQYSAVKHSSDLSVKDFSELIEGALMLAMQLGLKIPPKPFYGLEK